MPTTIPLTSAARVPASGRGTTLSFVLPATSTTTTATTYILNNITNVDGPNVTIGEVETTVLSSTFKPYVPTLPEGEMTVTAQFITGDPALQAIRQMVASGVSVPTVPWTITYPLEPGLTVAATDTFPGFVKGFPITGHENETVPTVAISIRITGGITSTNPS